VATPEFGFKLNIDGSYNYSSKGGIGGEIWDYRGFWLEGLLTKINVVNALNSELLAILLGLKMIVRLSISTHQIDIDSLYIIDIIYIDHGSFTSTILECREPTDQP